MEAMRRDLGEMLTGERPTSNAELLTLVGQALCRVDELEMQNDARAVKDGAER